MLNSWNLDKAIIGKAFINNELDKSIHETYNKHEKTGYYQMFCNKNMRIGNTFI